MLLLLGKKKFSSSLGRCHAMSSTRFVLAAKYNPMATVRSDRAIHHQYLDTFVPSLWVRSDFQRVPCQGTIAVVGRAMRHSHVSNGCVEALVILGGVVVFVIFDDARILGDIGSTRANNTARTNNKITVGRVEPEPEEGF